MPHMTSPRTSPPVIPAARGIYCNRTLNLRALKAIGYDMDYTLVDYHAEVFERRVYAYAQERLASLGWPVQELAFDSGMVARGLVIDTELGNVVKANRFGFVKKAMHGTRSLEFSAQREAYNRTLVDLSESRWVFLNTLFSLSEGCLYAQLVDLLDRGQLPGVLGYTDLYERVRRAVDAQHFEGHLKAEIMADPTRYVVHDPEVPLALLDQKQAGKKLLLITNSEWSYTSAMMRHAFDPHLPEGMTWRELFDVVIVSARKPDFFTERSPFLEVVSEDGLLKPVVGPIQLGKAYFGGSAVQVERDFGVSGDEILYVGDHLWGDMQVTKRLLRWRTALVLRELEAEVEALAAFREQERWLAKQMEEKEALEAEVSWIRLALQRIRKKHPMPLAETPEHLESRLNELKVRIAAIDETLGPVARAATELVNPRWGLLTRTGNDKSHLARQVERHADIYTSRVSNFLAATPFAFLRSPRGSLPHDL